MYIFPIFRSFFLAAGKTTGFSKFSAGFLDLLFLIFFVKLLGVVGSNVSKAGERLMTWKHLKGLKYEICPEYGHLEIRHAQGQSLQNYCTRYIPEGHRIVFFCFVPSQNPFTYISKKCKILIWKNKNFVTHPLHSCGLLVSTAGSWSFFSFQFRSPFYTTSLMNACN